MSRDDFPAQVKDALAKRVGMHCSNPDCRQLTTGPHEDLLKSTNIGVASHITAASTGGPRFNSLLTGQERGGIQNGIWLCQNCAKLIDSDPERYNADLLKAWKLIAEEKARADLQRPAPNQGSRNPRLEATAEFKWKRELIPMGLSTQSAANIIVSVTNHGLGTATRAIVVASRVAGHSEQREIGPIAPGETRKALFPLALGTSLEAIDVTLGRDITIEYDGESTFDQKWVLRMSSTHPPRWDLVGERS